MKRKSLIISVIILLLSLTIINQIRLINKKNIIKANKKISTGFIIKFNTLAKGNGNLNVVYKFTIGDREVVSSCIIRGVRHRSFKDNFSNKSFPLVYDSSKFESNELLITPDRFKKYDIVFPDSLNWVKLYWVNDYKTFD